MYISVFDEIVFIEGNHSEAKRLQPIEIKIRGMFTDSQLKTLDDVKQKMASFAKYDKANCIVEFKYGQRSSFLGSFFNRDDITWYGSGFTAILPNELYKNYLDKK